MNLEKDTWKIISNYFDTTPNYITKHHLDSFNDFVNNKIYDIFNDNQKNPQVVVLIDKENPVITYLINIYYGGRNRDLVNLSRPIIYNALKEEVKPMYPNEARLKNLTYAFNVFCDIEIEYVIKEDTKEIFRQFSPTVFKDINIGRVPIMLNSDICALSLLSKETKKKFGECPYDHGGYFVIDGREKVCVSRERKSENTLYINKSGNPDFTWSAEVKSVPAEFRYARNTYLHVVEKTGEIVIENPYFKSGKSETGGKYIPLFVLFRALGIETDKEILEFIFHNLDEDNQFSQQGLELLMPSFNNEDNKTIYDQISALGYLEKFIKKMDTDGSSGSGDIQRNRLERYSVIFKNIYDNLYPHVGDDFRDKALYLGYCVNQLLQVILGVKEETDRDSYEYKRIDLSGFMIANLFRDGFLQLQYDARNKISSAFEFGYIEYKGEMITNVVNEGSVKTIFSSTSSEEIVLKGFRTGTLSNPGGTTSKKGVIQQIDRRGFYSYLGQIRRVVTPNDTGTRVQIDQRRLHVSQYGYMCPMTIMDGSNVGIKKHFTCLAQVSSGCPTEGIKKAILDGGLIPLADLHPRLLYKQTKVFLNGTWIGVHPDPPQLLEWIRLLKRNALINIYTSISWKIKEDVIYVYCDGGRCVRPLFIVEDNKHTITEKMIEDLKANKISWMDLIGGFKSKKLIGKSLREGATKWEKLENSKSMSGGGNGNGDGNIPIIHNNYYHPHLVGFSKTDTIEDLKKHSGVIEYLDNNDMNNVMLSSSINLDSKFVEYTHTELHEAMMLSLEAQGVPFPEYNQLPRNVYGIGQSKQAISIYATNYMNRIETTAMILSHPQKPLNNSRLGKYIFNDKLGHGQNIIVAVSAYTGYNQEDSVICCQDSLDLGMLKISYYKGYEATEKQDPKTGTFEYFYNPKTMEAEAQTQNQTDGIEQENILVQPKEYNDYSHLDQYGFIREGTHCKKGNEIVIGKYMKITRGDEPPRDISIDIKGKGETIDKVFTTYIDDTKTKLVKIRTVKERIAVLGDKIGSRYGQKGVLGITLRREDMPHTKSGIRPDIIISPGAFPKRMTNAQLIETIYAKLSSILGLVGDATAFIPKNVEDIANKLEEYGFQGMGDEILYSGIDGQQMSSHLFIGPVFYQRFKQMVGDKIHSRNSGARNEEDLSTMGGGYTARERQPLAGRALGGGGRIGEMERDAIVCHGIAGFLKETMMERSDKYYTHICENSGRLAVVNPSENLYLSPDVDGPIDYDIIETLELNKNENRGREIEEVLGPNTFKQSETGFFRAYMPYCAKLMIQECEAMGLSIRLRADNSNHREEPFDINSDNPNKQNKESEMISSRISNVGFQMDEEMKELENLKEYIKNRFNKNKEDEAEDKEKDEENDEENDDVEGSGSGSDKEAETEDSDKETEEEDSKNNEGKDEGKYKGYQKGGDREEAINYYLGEKSDGIALPSIADTYNQTSFFETENLKQNHSQIGGNQTIGLYSLDDIGHDVLNPVQVRQNLDPMKTAFGQMDRPYFNPILDKDPNSHPQNQSGGNVQNTQTHENKSDIKIINLDPNYRINEEETPLQQQQTQLQPQIQQSGGNNNRPIIPTQNVPQFNEEIFIS